jgi:hypothetical protein
MLVMRVVASSTTGRGKRFTVYLAMVTVLAATAGAFWFVVRSDAADAQYIDIARAGRAPAEPTKVGTYSWDCGRNEERHLNTANVVTVPGVPGPTHHVHDYIGNLATDVNSTVEGLANGETTCANGDRSTYFWPVLRTGVRAGAAGHGEIQTPASVTLTLYGSPTGPVVPMPRFLRATVGDARAATNPMGLDRPTWTCASEPQRRTEKYPLCPPGDQVVRVFDFPSCWDGMHADSADHRGHLVFPDAAGFCPAGTFAVPRLKITIGYARPGGTAYAIDTFPEQRNSPITDHAFFVNLMPEQLMAMIVGCLNTGKKC